MNHFSDGSESEHDSDSSSAAENRKLRHLSNKLSVAIESGFPSSGSMLTGPFQTLFDHLGILLAKQVVGKTGPEFEFSKVISNCFHELLIKVFHRTYDPRIHARLFDDVARYLDENHLETSPYAVAMNGIWIRYATALTGPAFSDEFKRWYDGEYSFQDLVSLTPGGGNPDMARLGRVLRGLKNFLNKTRMVIFMMWTKQFENVDFFNEKITKIRELLTRICEFINATRVVLAQFVNYYPELLDTKFVSLNIIVCIEELRPLISDDVPVSSEFLEAVSIFLDIIHDNNRNVVESGIGLDMAAAYEQYHTYVSGLRPQLLADKLDRRVFGRVARSDDEPSEHGSSSRGGDGGGGPAARGPVRGRGRVRGASRGRGRGRVRALDSSSEGLGSGHVTPLADEDAPVPPPPASKPSKRKRDAASAAAAAGSPEVAMEPPPKKAAVPRKPRKVKDPSADPKPKTPRKSRAKKPVTIEFDLSEAIEASAVAAGVPKQRSLTRLERELGSSSGYAAASRAVAVAPVILRDLPVAVARRLPSRDVGQDQSGDDYMEGEGAGGVGDDGTESDEL